jgi:hypothetical protein
MAKSVSKTSSIKKHRKMGSMKPMSNRSLMPSSSSAGEFSHEEPESEEEKTQFLSSFKTEADHLKTHSDDSSYTKVKKRRARAEKAQTSPEKNSGSSSGGSYESSTVI